MGTHASSDESILKLFENIRLQVAADTRLGSKHRLLGETARREALRLEEELRRRGLPVTPIVWR
ncbi:hypothetical protein ACVIGB_000222 [Bradyrhizobium sp. USDA 4341]